MRSKSLIALSILCLALGACATTNDTATDDPNVAKAEDHANQSSTAARADDVSYSTLTPKTEQTTVTTTGTEPVWNSTVENPPATGSTLVQSGSTTTVSGTTADTTADTTIIETNPTTTATTSGSSTNSMTSSSTVDDDDDDTTTATETRTRLRKD